MKNIYTITSNTSIANGVYRMELSGDTSLFSRPGQFVNIALPGFYLRRPISVCDWSDEGFTIIYKVFGEGTEYMSTLPAGEELDILVGLGNGFMYEKAGTSPLVVGGGVGTPPLYGLAKRLAAAGTPPVVVLGFRNKEDIFLTEEFEALGCEVHVATSSGQAGTKGYVTDILPTIGEYSYFYACGPGPMLNSLVKATASDGELSFEERMPCGFGACMSCACKTKVGTFKLCTQGPVIAKGNVIVE